jgi:membrane protein insertase Oxa1/YidC/SpoIIIJ
MPDIWFTYLYQPLLNGLVWIYNNLAGQNMGWSVIILTVFLRTALLPLSIISQRDILRQNKTKEEAARAADMFKNDAVARNEEYRRIMKKNKISPWAKVVVLGIQLLVLILLYQVFISGIFGERLVKVLYPSVGFPGTINNDFFGFNIGATHSLFWAGLVAVYLMFANLIEKIGSKEWERSEAVFFILFPLFVFIALWLLPVAKALFILTSIIFSDILTLVRLAFFTPKNIVEIKPI